MESGESQRMAVRYTALRQELKIWEKTFFEQYARKPTRDEIKQNPEIAAKYKEFQRLKDIQSGKIPPPSVESQTPRKRKLEEEDPGLRKRLFSSDTPSRHNQTPSNRSMRPWELDPHLSPSVMRNLFSPSAKLAIGPTPQRDGQVLGMFDLLTEDTPPKRLGSSVKATPSKAKFLEEDIHARHSRTPASLSKSRMLDAFLTTPSNRRKHDAQGQQTPSTVSKLNFSDTPSFLRRGSNRIKLPAVEGTEHDILSPEIARLPRKPLVRGLSNMLEDLRKMEDDAADENMDMLEELENEQANGPKPLPKKMAPPPKKPVLEIVEEEEAPPRLLGGFDDEANYDSEPEEDLGRDGQPLKVYKKKGQKRTTRRVKMKPSRSTKPIAVPDPPVGSDAEPAAEPKEEVVPETQDPEEESFVDTARNFDSDSQSEYTASEGGTRYRRPDQSKKRKVMGKDGKIKAVARKVGALAHTNFKRLKIRGNTGAKGGPAHNSRFRRKK